MNKSLMNRIFATLSFVVSLITYLMTVQPTVPFWDCGEFSGASVWQQVPHPPGAPLFLMIGKVFHTIIPFGDDGWRINLVSVFASAFTILLVYLITYRIIENLMEKKAETMADYLAIYGSAFIAALAFNFSDTFWFNGVESEVYATSTLFVALVIYLMMLWNENYDKPGNEKYILLIAYMIGLSIGVHLLAILTTFSIVYLIYFKKYKYSLLSFLAVGIGSIILFFIIYPGIVKWIPALLAGHLPFKNDAQEYTITNNIVLKLIPAILVIAAGYYLWWANKKGHHIVALATASFLLIIIGYTTYTQILLRSNSNSPMNENEPKNLERLVSYLGREQYGSAPNWPRRYQTDSYYTQFYTKQEENGEYRYGIWYPPTKKEVYKEDGTGFLAPEFTKVNAAGELNYLWKYQIYHMYIRYFLWNFVGRSSDIQDSGVAWFDTRESDIVNANSGFKEVYPIRFFALPLLFGLIGLFFHFSKDKKMAFVFLLMFLMMGVLAAIQQNQQEPQPRERDYFYSGSFMVFAMWIGVGVFAIIDNLKKYQNKTFIPALIVLISMILVPVNMAAGGWKMHNRAGNYFPFDYSYNILQSVEQDAIVFTNGDNDTFPVWYLQDVAGVRRDVRIVNLSLGNTLWYIDQLKNRQPWGALKVPISIPDDSLQVYDETDPRAYTYEFAEAQNVVLNVPSDIMAKFTNDEELINDPKMRFTFVGQDYGEYDGKQIYLFRVQDKLIFDILKTNNFKRPMYFSATVGEDVYIGLKPFLKRGGLALRITPVQQSFGGDVPLDIEIMDKCLLNYDNSDNYTKTPKYGFKYRNLNNPAVFYDEVHRRSIEGYRLMFLSLAQAYATERKDNAKANKVLETMDKVISTTMFPLDWNLTARIADLYSKVGNKDKAKKYALSAIKKTEDALAANQIMNEMVLYDLMGKYQGPYTTMSDMAYLIGDYQLGIQKVQETIAYAKAMLGSLQSNPQYAQYAQFVKGNIPMLYYKILTLQMEEAEKKGGKEAQIKFIQEEIQRMEKSTDPDYKALMPQLQQFLSQPLTTTDSAQND